jgi:predicted Zn-dependent protease
MRIQAQDGVWPTTRSDSAENEAKIRQRSEWATIRSEQPFRLHLDARVGRIGRDVGTGDSQGEGLARSGDVDGAAQLADELIGAHPNSMQVWLLRGHLHERTDNHIAAATDLTRAIELESGEPHLFYTRGRMRFQLGDDAGGRGFRPRPRIMRPTRKRLLPRGVALLASRSSDPSWQDTQGFTRPIACS